MYLVYWWKSVWIKHFTNFLVIRCSRFSDFIICLSVLGRTICTKEWCIGEITVWEKKTFTICTKECLILLILVEFLTITFETFFSWSLVWNNMLKKAEGSFYVFFGEIILFLQLWIWTTRSELCEDTFTIYKDDTLVISNGVTIQNSVSLAQCTTECRSNVKCSAASYSETTLECHLDISGTCNFQKTPATGWTTIIRANFGKYIN